MPPDQGHEWIRHEGGADVREPAVFFPGNGILTRFNGIEIEFIGFHVIYGGIWYWISWGIYIGPYGIYMGFISDFMGLNGVQSYLVWFYVYHVEVLGEAHLV